MKKSYKIVFTIILLLVFLSTITSFINYIVSLDNTKGQLKEQSLPLSIDNIYTDIQKHVIEPYLISSMMATDTFVQEWLLDENKSEKKIANYLSAIQKKYEKYNIYSTYIIDNKTLKYYKSHGYHLSLKKDNKFHQWYFTFLKEKNEHRMNLGLKKNQKNKFALFIDHKINYKDKVIGITGVSLQISYINEMLKKFKSKHKFRVFFFNKKGDIILSEDLKSNQNIFSNSVLQKNKTNILEDKITSLEYKKASDSYILNTKYIPELGLYLMVEAKLDDFVKDVKQIFYINLIISMIITFIIAYIIISLIRRNNIKLEKLANNDSLTKLNNRRFFSESLEEFYKFNKNKNISLAILFIDIDNFKNINDSLGHEIGDKVLKQSALCLKNSIRKTDLVSRWGGEEFVVALKNTNKDEALELAKKIANNLKKDNTLKEYLNKELTVSMGVSLLQKDDSIDSLLNRADKAMYDAKSTGKDRVCFR